MIDIESIRKEFPVTEKFIYMNHAAIGPASRKVRKTVDEALDEWTFGGAPWAKWDEDCPLARKLFAKLIGANKNEIALLPTINLGVSLVAESVSKRRGKSNIVVSGLEFASNRFPWLNQQKKGMEIRQTKASEEIIDYTELEQLLDDNTAAVAVATVQSQNGYRADINRIVEIAREHDVWVFVDGFQSVGALDFDVKKVGIDFLGCSSHKWFCGLTGASYLYFRSDLIEEIEPIYVNWRSDVSPMDAIYRDHFILPESAQRFDTGTPAWLSYTASRAALEFIHQIGVKTIESRILSLTKQLEDALIAEGLFTEINPKERKSNIMTIQNLKNPEQTVQELRKENIIVAKRGDGIRIAPHHYNVISELEKFLEVLNTILSV